MKMTREQWDGLIDHAREEKPNECCGFVSIREGVVLDVVRAKNVQPSPMYGYRVDSDTMLAAYKASEAGHDIGMYHSHPRSSAQPSQTDINLAEYTDYLYLIVGLGEEEGPSMRAWRIADGRVDEEEIEVA